MDFKTDLCSLLDIDYPIIQGGMAWVATGELAAAVSEAGGLGLIGAGNAPAEIVREEIDKVRELTNKPFGVNIMFLSPFAGDIVELVVEKGVPIVTTGAGNPGKYMDKFEAAGIKVVPVVPSVALGRRMEKNGAHALIAEGNEAGGHIGKLTTMTLIPQLVDAVDIPVIAAGGIADGRGLAAALCLGASAVQMGTRFVCCQECTTSEEYKQAVLGASDRDAVVTGESTGHPVRNLKNRLTQKMKKLEQKGASPEALEELGRGKLREAVREGNVEEGSVMAGQISGLITEIKSAEEIIMDTVEQAAEIIDINNDYFGG
ncbi:MAG: enoyl-[acyl-carrier-protein] reductase FabK [Halanaerobiales bacterium]